MVEEQVVKEQVEAVGVEGAAAGVEVAAVKEKTRLWKGFRPNKKAF